MQTAGPARAPMQGAEDPHPALLPRARADFERPTAFGSEFNRIFSLNHPDEHIQHDSMFNCPDCDKAYSKQTSLNRHHQNHRKSKQHTCPICHVSFFRRDLLSRHDKMHRSNPSSLSGSAMRQRCHTACISCRNSRTKCDGSQPCLSCINSGKTCEYSRTMNRISRAPLHTMSDFSESAPHENTRNESSVGYDGGPRGLGWEEDREAPDQESHDYNMNVDEPEFNSIVPCPAASSDGPFFRNDGNIQEPQTNSISQSFQEGEQGLDEANLSIGIVDPFLTDLTSDTMAWPWLHENLFLEREYPEVWPENNEQYLMSEDVGGNLSGHIGDQTAQMLDVPSKEQQDFRIGGQNIATTESAFTSGVGSSSQRQDTEPIQTTRDSSRRILNPIQADGVQTSEHAAAQQSTIIDEIVTQATELGSFLDTKAGRANHWSSMSTKARDVFGLQNEQDQHSPHVLQAFINLYLQHFGPLWPLISRQNLDCDLLHPLLYLTLTSIGGMYGGAQAAHFATMMHRRLRQTLIASLDFGEIDDHLVWLAQARLLTQVAALYFGQSQGFSYAQQLGAILVAQARRMNLFKQPRYRNDDSMSVSQRTTSERLARWLYLEARRRLAFGILRTETYTSVLLNTRPLISPEEIDLQLPYADSTWRGPPLPPEIYLAMVERDRASRLMQPFSDVIRVALERDEMLSVLDPLGNELLIFGLQQSVWRFSHDQRIFLRLTGNMESSSQLGYDGLDTLSVSPHELDRSISVISAGQPIEPTLSPTSEDHLMGSPKRMNDLQIDFDRVIAGLQKWKESLKFIRNGISLQQDRNSVLSGLLLYHLSYLWLQAPVEDMHYVSYRVADKRPIEKEFIEDVSDWANSGRAAIAVQHACTIWSLIIREIRRPEKSRANFNFLAFIGLHHAAVALWTYIGARNRLESQEAGLLEHLVDSEPKIAIIRRNSKAILVLFSQVFHLVGPGNWSSFGAAALKLSECQFPRPE